MTDAKEDRISIGWFQAKYLQPLHGFVKYAREVHPYHMMYGSIRLEPADIGGVYIIALTGHATAIIHDPDGYIDAPVTLDIPDAAFNAARGLQAPLMNYCGEEYEVTLPEWLQPWRVYVYSAGMHICTKMRNPAWAGEDDEFHPALYSTGCSVGHHTRGLDYTATRTKNAVNWRALLSTRPVDAGHLCFNPVVPALFNSLIDVLAKEHPFSTAVHSLRKATNTDAPMHIFQMTNCPEFVGMWMGVKPVNPPEIPAHFLTAPAQPASNEEAA